MKYEERPSADASVSAMIYLAAMVSEVAASFCISIESSCGGLIVFHRDRKTLLQKQRDRLKFSDKFDKIPHSSLRRLIQDLWVIVTNNMSEQHKIYNQIRPITTKEEAANFPLCYGSSIEETVIKNSIRIPFASIYLKMKTSTPLMQRLLSVTIHLTRPKEYMNSVYFLFFIFG